MFKEHIFIKSLVCLQITKVTKYNIFQSNAGQKVTQKLSNIFRFKVQVDILNLIFFKYIFSLNSDLKI